MRNDTKNCKDVGAGRENHVNLDIFSKKGASIQKSATLVIQTKTDLPTFGLRLWVGFEQVARGGNRAAAQPANGEALPPREEALRGDRLGFRRTARECHGLDQLV